MHTDPMTRRRPRAAKRGFTIVELIVAIMIMTVGVLGLAGTAAVVSRLIGGGAQQTIAANVAGGRFERLRSMQCTDLAKASGTAVTRGMTEKVVVKPVSGNANLYVVVDTVTWRFAGGRQSRSQPFTSYIRC